MSEKVYKYIKNKFSMVETEIWDLNIGDTRTVQPNLPNDYRYGIAVYLVPSGYCSNT